MILMFRKCSVACINCLWLSAYFMVLLFLFIFGKNDILLALVTTVLVIGSSFLFKNTENRKKICIMCAAFFVMQLFLAFSIYFRAGWDVDTLTNAAWDDVFIPKLWPEQLIKGYDYLNMYPNNILLYGYYTLIARICFALKRGQNFYYALMILVNIIIYTFTSFFLHENVRKLADERYAMIAWHIYLIIIGTSGWYIVPYSDSLTLFIPSLCLYIWLYMRSYYKWLPLSFLSVLGFYIKPQSFIFMIALLMISIIYDLQLYDLKKKILPLILSLACALIIVLPVQSIKRDYFEPDKALGFTHFAMMGLNSETGGSYSIDDVGYSLQFKTAKERTQGNIEMIRKRLGENDMAEHFKKKLLFNFNDGNFYFGKEGYFYSYISADLLPVSAFLKDVFLDTGRYYPLLAGARHMLYIAVVLLTLFSFKDKRKEVLLIKLSLTGLFLFQMLFEARSRYILIYIPFFIILACISIKEIRNMIGKVKERRTA